MLGHRKGDEGGDGMTRREMKQRICELEERMAYLEGRLARLEARPAWGPWTAPLDNTTWRKPGENGSEAT